MSTRFLRALFSSLAALAITLISTTPYHGHDVRTSRQDRRAEVDEHIRLDFGWPGFADLNEQLKNDFLTFDNTENLLLSAFAGRVIAPANSHIVGHWSPVFGLPLVPIHVMVLTNGKVLMWDSVGDLAAETYETHDFTRASIWDPETNIVTNVNVTTGYNVFCAGFAHLPDGTPFLAGGNLNSALGGTNTIHLFDQINSTWSRGPNMTQGNRWYPSVTPLANGEMLITSGRIGVPEVYTTQGTLRTLSSATHNAIPLYPWFHATPDGRALHFGPENGMVFYNTAGTGSRSMAGPRDQSPINREYGSFAMYDIGKIMASGGRQPPTNGAVHIDVLRPTGNPITSPLEPMHFARRQHNLTVLPDGTVLATGGFSGNRALVDLSSSVFMAELWDPETGDWTQLSEASRMRQYHSSAILLPDGRVLTGGGGICGDCDSENYLEKNMEIYTPPYLYDSDGSGNLAPRPALVSAPGSVEFDESFFVETPDAQNVSQAVMMRVSSVTHSVDFEQRRVPLVKEVTVGGLNLKAPPNSNIAPPGYYMLFLLDSDGVPSIAKMIRVEFGTGLGAPLIVDPSGGGGSATLSWVPVLGATNYTVKFGTTSGVYTETVNLGNLTTHTVNGLAHWRHYFVVSASGPTVAGGNSAEVEIFTNVVPTAAWVTVSGRAQTLAGFGLSRVDIHLLSVEGEVIGRTISNPFGYYEFADVPAGQSYIVSASGKRYTFANPSVFISTEDNVSGVDFIGTR